MNQIDLDYTDEPVCPHCGAEMADAWEYQLLDGDSEVVDCGRCGQQYKMTRNIDVTYSTAKPSQQEVTP